MQHGPFTGDASAGTGAPTPLVIPIHRAPKKAPCPNCSTHGLRKRAFTRRVRTVAYRRVAFLEITCGEYQARCDCCTTFRNTPTPQGVLPKAFYGNKVRDLVLGRILDDGPNVERAIESIRRDFLLDLPTGFVYDVLRDRAAQLEMAAHRHAVLGQFGGTPCVDELHLSRSTMLPATDPLADLPVAFALVDRDDSDPMRRLLKNLKTRGLIPRVAVTDGSNLYPSVLAELWPDADHQLRAFHVIKEIDESALDAVRRLRTAMGRRGKAGRKKKRGKTRRAKAAAVRRGPPVKQKAYFVSRHRHPVVKRRENLTQADRDDLVQMLECLPELATLRRFANRIYWLFDTPEDFHQASCRRAAILCDPGFRAVSELVKAVEQLDAEKSPNRWPT